MLGGSEWRIAFCTALLGWGSAVCGAGEPAFLPATILERVAPECTPEARAAGLQGSVVLYLAVSAAGELEKGKAMEASGVVEIECHAEHATKDDSPTRNETRPAAHISDKGISPPTVVYKFEPEYSEEALQAKLEGCYRSRLIDPATR
jgi:hypothetical protein